jgi:uncharacterized protein YggL (DUF469 family)
MPSTLHTRSAAKALHQLKKLHLDEYQALYRAEVEAAGGRTHPSRAEKIAHLRAEIARLEGKEV